MCYNVIMNTNRTLISVLIILAVVVGIYFFFKSEKIAVSPYKSTDTTGEEADTISLCFYYEKLADRGQSDIAWLKLNLTGDEVAGEFQNIPVEKDKKIGIFDGTVGPLDPIAMARTADVWWHSEAEGMNVTEQLKIVFGEGNATVGFGEMVDRGDGVYVYKDISNLYYIPSMSDVACQELDDKITIGK